VKDITGGAWCQRRSYSRGGTAGSNELLGAVITLLPKMYAKAKPKLLSVSSTTKSGTPSAFQTCRKLRRINPAPLRSSSIITAAPLIRSTRRGAGPDWLFDGLRAVLA